MGTEDKRKATTSGNKKPTTKVVKPVRASKNKEPFRGDLSHDNLQTVQTIGTDKKVAYMATFPSREANLALAIQSLINQVDELVIVCNGDIEIEENPKIRKYNTLDIFGDIGCAGKFLFCYEWNGYVFTVDDDFIYPPDYIEKTVNVIESYKREAVISWHGRTLPPVITKYKHGHKEFYQCCKTVNEDHEVNILGTGVTGFHSSTIKPTYDIMEMRHANCSDIYFSKSLDMRNIPMIVPKHDENWLIPLKNASAISFCNQESFLVPLINSYNWKEL